MDNKKKITLLIIGIFVLALLVALYFVIRSQTNPYVKEPIAQQSLSLEKGAISVGSTVIEASDGVLYTISKTVMLNQVEDFVRYADSKLQQTERVEGSYYEWMDGNNYVTYDLEDNTLMFGIENGVAWNEASLTEYSFNQFVKEHFEKDWKYTLSVTRKIAEGDIVYYANRKVGDFNIEMVSDNESTDYLEIKNGRITYGKFLLTELVAEEKKVPLIDSADLEKYINVNGYPKEIHPEFGSLRTTILAEIDYKSDEFENVIKTLSNCKSSLSTIVYLYKSLNQGNLTPVYKLDLQCELTYKDTVYTIPAIGYVNAIDPQYISTVE